MTTTSIFVNEVKFKVGDIVYFNGAGGYSGIARIDKIRGNTLHGVTLKNTWPQNGWAWSLLGPGTLTIATEVAKALYL